MNIILKLIAAQALKGNFIGKKNKKVLMINNYIGKKQGKKKYSII
jgi:hypothetical protein